MVLFTVDCCSGLVSGTVLLGEREKNQEVLVLHHPTGSSRYIVGYPGPLQYPG